MRSRSWWFPALAAVVGGVPGAAQESPSPVVVVPPLEFAWPLPAKAVVVKVGAKQGNEAKLRFRLAVANDTSDELRARMTQFEFLEVGGRDATTPEMVKAMQPALALAQAVPDIVADEKGVYRRMDGLDAMVKRVSEHMSQQEGRSAKESDTMLRQMQSPAMLDLLQQACSLYWNTWAGAWVGFDLALWSGAGRRGRDRVLRRDVPGEGDAAAPRRSRRPSRPRAARHRVRRRGAGGLGLHVRMGEGGERAGEEGCGEGGRRETRIGQWPGHGHGVPPATVRSRLRRGRADRSRCCDCSGRDRPR